MLAAFRYTTGYAILCLAVFYTVLPLHYSAFLYFTVSYYTVMQYSNLLCLNVLHVALSLSCCAYTSLRYYIILRSAAVYYTLLCSHYSVLYSSILTTSYLLLNGTFLLHCPIVHLAMFIAYFALLCSSLLCHRSEEAGHPKARSSGDNGARRA